MKTRLRVAATIEEGKLGGPQIYLMNVAKVLSDIVETVVIMPEENSLEFQQRCQNLDVPFILKPLTRISKDWRNVFRYIWYSPWEIFKLVRYFRQEDFDLVHVCGGSWQFKGAIAGKLAGIPVMWHLNDTSMPIPIRWVFGILSGLAKGYAYASERSKSYYGSYVKVGRFECTIPAPVDTTRFDPELDLPPDELLPELNGKLVIGTVANPSPVKNLETFLRMAAKLGEQNAQPLTFIVVGKVYVSQQTYFQSLEHLANQLGVSVYWAGPRQDVRPLLKRLDVYVCSSRAESSPISVWEAMSMAKPIVSTDVGDVPLYVKDGENGFIVPIGDVSLLADRVGQILQDSIKRKHFGKISRQIALQNFDILNCGERHLEAYQLLSSK